MYPPIYIYPLISILTHILDLALEKSKTRPFLLARPEYQGAYLGVTGTPVPITLTSYLDHNIPLDLGELRSP